VDIDYLDTQGYQQFIKLQLHLLDDGDVAIDIPDDDTEDNTEDCAICSAAIDTDKDNHIVVDGDYVCETCADSHFVYSDATGDWIERAYAVFTTDTEEYYPEDHSDIFQCDDCGDWYTHDRTCRYSVDNDYKEICQDCCESGDYSFCEDIEQYVNNDSCYYSEYNDCCYYYSDNMPENDRGGVHCYSANVLEVIGRYCFVNGEISAEFGRALVMGMELETDSRGCANIAEVLSEQTDLQDYAICKSDATCTGPEIVTLPADLHSHKSVYSWKSWCEVLRPIAKGYHGGDNGIHIHINRAALSATTLGKMLVFMNHRDNRQFVEVIAQRPFNGWCNTNAEKYDSVAKSAYEPCDGKYSAINVMQSTAEVRIFNSTLLENRIFKNLEFCDALVNYCRMSSDNHKDDYMLPHRFIRFVSEHRGTYPNLAEFINSRWQ
jgi:hypothetical protein